ncbi:MAG: lysine--tRNA ligase [Alphaproteobacteria bacterium]|nr:lysine--tRNA ligase [Alphaproteobacteria bacterium]
MAETKIQMNDTSNIYRDTRLQKVDELRAMGVNPYPYRFDKTHDASDLHEKYQHLSNGEETADRIQIAGRVMSIRNSGMFIDLLDASGRIQIFSHKDTLPETYQPILKLLDLGDIIGVTGLIRRTPRGELTINADSIEVLCKSLQTLPEKYHGLSDVEMRYRQRYVDLIMNEPTRLTLRKRSQIIQALRSYLLSLGFLEVETPMLHSIPGGAAAKPFITHHNALDMELYMRIAPELFLKRLVVGGLSEKVFEVNRCFRNEGISTRHNPEFTMVELYQAYADYQDMMNLAEKMIEHIAETVLGTTTISYNGHEINLKGPWIRKSMTDLVREHTGIDFLAIHDLAEAQDAAKKIGVDVKLCGSWGKVVAAVFEEKVESFLIQPTHVTDLPLDISPLAKVHRTDPRLTERFESFINTWEVANAFSELTDPIDQRARLESQVADRDAGDDEAHLMDEDFITALEYGLPPTGGLGIGIDRMVMLMTDSSSIRDVIAFPTMRKRG